MSTRPSDGRPRILLLIDVPDWAFHTIARAVVQHLSDRFAFTILIKDQYPHIEEKWFDLVHVFYEFEEYHRPFFQGKAKVLRSVYSHYWEIEHRLDPMQFYLHHLSDAHAISVPSRKLLHAFRGIPPPVSLFAEGVDPNLFRSKRMRTGPLTVGWAGKPAPMKRLELLQEACNGLCDLKIATGNLHQQEMVDFYNNVDVIACTSLAEGCPRPLLEGMACGCYPVTFDVGVAPEVITHGVNGLIVGEQTVTGMRSALQWCAENIGDMRAGATLNPEIIHATRTWKATTAHLANVYTRVLG